MQFGDNIFVLSTVTLIFFSVVNITVRSVIVINILFYKYILEDIILGFKFSLIGLLIIQQ